MVARFKHISAEQTQESLDNDSVTVLDIRDPQSYELAHIDGAQRLDNASLPSFLSNTDKASPVIVYCYHGISSQQVAQFLIEQGFEDVASMDGGFEAWKTLTQVS